PGTVTNAQAEATAGNITHRVFVSANPVVLNAGYTDTFATAQANAIADIAETANVAGTVADTVTGQWSSQYQKEGRASDDTLASARGRAAAGATATAALAYYASPRQPSDQTTFRTAVFSAVKNQWLAAGTPSANPFGFLYNANGATPFSPAIKSIDSSAGR